MFSNNSYLLSGYTSIFTSTNLVSNIFAISLALSSSRFFSPEKMPVGTAVLKQFDRVSTFNDFKALKEFNFELSNSILPHNCNVSKFSSLYKHSKSIDVIRTNKQIDFIRLMLTLGTI